MSDEVLQFIIVVGFGALCFGCGCLTAFIVTRTKFRNEMIKRGVARYNQQTGKWEWGEPPTEPKEPRTWKVSERGGSRRTSPSCPSYCVHSQTPEQRKNSSVAKLAGSDR
jgi:hypothetical protein